MARRRPNDRCTLFTCPGTRHHTHGVATARMCRSVLSDTCTLAARHGALARTRSARWAAHRPARDRTPRADRAAAPAAARALSYDQKAAARDLPDLVAFLMATGLRIGEACGLPWDAVDLQAGTIEVRAAAGPHWVTSHVLRKTVATLVDHAGLSTRAAADQLGHANTS